MNLSLPRPYPDELIYSVFARYFGYLQPTSVASAHRAIDGHRRFSTQYVRGAANLAEKTRLSWGLSGLEIIDRHTMLPFYGAFLDRETYLRCTECFMAESPRGGATTLGLSNSCVTQPHFLRFCSSCLSEDIESLGETYWRRQHQLSGTLVCIRHDEVLRDSTARFGKRNETTMLDATAHCAPAFGPHGTLIQNELHLARLIAERSAAVLTGTPTSWLTSNICSQYQKAAMEKGYRVGIAKLNINELAKDIVGFYGTAFLEKLGCNLSERSISLRRAFYPAGTHHPLVHILIQIFLESKMVSSRSVVTSPGIDHVPRRDWKCPNTYARHHESFRIPTISLRRSREGTTYYHGRCTCGFTFAFSESQKGDPSKPKVRRTSGYGIAMENEARRLYKRRRSVRYVAEIMGLSHKVADRLVKRQKSRNELNKERISRLRVEWSKIESRSSYQALMKWDRDWLRAYRQKTSGQSIKAVKTTAQGA